MSATILIVDPCDDVRQRLQSSLDLDGYDVIQAQNGAEGLAQVLAAIPDLVLLDHSLPDMDGIELLLKIKEHRDTRGTSVVMIANDGREDKVVSALELGATDFVPKPFSDSVVRARVRNALRVRNLQIRIRAEREHAETANANKSAFLARMSHEIRTPMTAILGFADILYLEGDIDRAPPHRIEAIRTIKRNAEYLLDLINDILDLSKAEAGRLGVERYRCSAVQVAAEVISLMRVRADKKGLPLRFRLDGPIPETVHTDPTRLRQVLINFMSNAIKFTHSGCVELTIRLLDDHGDDPQLLFEVQDTGIGLTPEQLARIFQPFTQATPYTGRDYGGTGLGLVISKQLAKMLGGTISVSSTAGVGSTFRLSIAAGSLEGVRLLTEASEADYNAGWRPPEPDQKILDCKVLLAEDGVDNQRLIGHVLSRAGAQVVVADNGKSAVELALAAWNDRRPFHVILMDMFMPVLDGFGATRQLRRAGYDSPILALTANAVGGNLQRCFDAGCDDCATKPIDRKQLVELVARYGRRVSCAALQG